MDKPRKANNKGTVSKKRKTSTSTAPQKPKDATKKVTNVITKSKGKTQNKAKKSNVKRKNDDYYYSDYSYSEDEKPKKAKKPKKVKAEKKQKNVQKEESSDFSQDLSEEAEKALIAAASKIKTSEFSPSESEDKIKGNKKEYYSDSYSHEESSDYNPPPKALKPIKQTPPPVDESSFVNRENDSLYSNDSSKLPKSPLHANTNDSSDYSSPKPVMKSGKSPAKVPEESESTDLYEELKPKKEPVKEKIIPVEEESSSSEMKKEDSDNDTDDKKSDAHEISGDKSDSDEDEGAKDKNKETPKEKSEPSEKEEDNKEKSDSSDDEVKNKDDNKEELKPAENEEKPEEKHDSSDNEEVKNKNDEKEKSNSSENEEKPKEEKDSSDDDAINNEKDDKEKHESSEKEEINNKNVEEEEEPEVIKPQKKSRTNALSMSVKKAALIKQIEEERLNHQSSSICSQNSSFCAPEPENVKVKLIHYKKTAKQKEKGLFVSDFGDKAPVQKKSKWLQFNSNSDESSDEEFNPSSSLVSKKEKIPDNSKLPQEIKRTPFANKFSDDPILRKENIENEKPVEKACIKKNHFLAGISESSDDDYNIIDSLESHQRKEIKAPLTRQKGKSANKKSMYLTDELDSDDYIEHVGMKGHASQIEFDVEENPKKAKKSNKKAKKSNEDEGMDIVARSLLAMVNQRLDWQDKPRPPPKKFEYTPQLRKR